MSRHRGLKGMIDEGMDEYDDYYDEDYEDEYYDEYDAPPVQKPKPKASNKSKGNKNAKGNPATNANKGSKKDTNQPPPPPSVAANDSKAAADAEAGMQSLTITSPHATSKKVSAEDVEAIRKTWKAPSTPASEEPASQKNPLSMVVVGHVDAGKSTLVGHTLYKLGYVDQRLIHKYQKESNAMGKSSFYLAWIMDEDEEERVHGVTVDVAQKLIETDSKVVTILDAPGHADYVPRMIEGVVEADVGLLVVDVTEGAFEKGLDGGQTLEHAMLCKALGVNQLLVALNKIDSTTPPFNQGRYRTVEARLRDVLTQMCRFRDDKIRFIPVSALSGENITQVKAQTLASWFTGPTLVSAIDQFHSPPRANDKPLRLVVNDTIATHKHLTVSCRVAQGRVFANQPLISLPLLDCTVPASIKRMGEDLSFASAGQLIDLVVNDVEKSRIHVGDVLVSGVKDDGPPPLMAKRFVAQITTFRDLPVPLIPGTQVQLHMQHVEVEANVSRLISLLSRDGSNQVHPRSIGALRVATVQIKLDRRLCIERQDGCRALSRFVLRQGGKTVAAGFVTDIPQSKKGTEASSE